MNIDIERIDYKQLPLTKFIQKYPKYTLYSAHKTFWDKDKVNNYLTQKQIRNKLAQQKLNDDLTNTISENDRTLAERFNLSVKEIKQRLNDWFWYSELLKWEIIDWKYIVEHRILLVRNS